MARKSNSKSNTPVVEETPVEQTAEDKAAAKQAEREQAKEARREAKLQEVALDSERAAWVAANARPAVSPCLCGCGGETKGRFVPGHDALLKRSLSATLEVGDDTAKAQAKAALATFGWDA